MQAAVKSNGTKCWDNILLYNENCQAVSENMVAILYRKLEDILKSRRTLLDNQMYILDSERVELSLGTAT